VKYRTSVKKSPYLLAVSAVLFFAASLLFVARRTELVRAVEYRTLDWRFRHFSDPARRDPRIVLVMLDQASLDHFEKDGVYWPWPRSLYGAALEYFKAAGAKAVVFDLLFTSPSPYGVSEDREFGRALKKAGMAVLAMETGAREDPMRATPPPERFALKLPGDFGRPKGSLRLPVPEILSGAAFLGDTSSSPDPDGVFRRVPLGSVMGGRLYPSLSLAAAMAATGAASLEGFPLSRGRMLIRFHGAALAPRFTRGRTTYASYSLGDVILSQLSLEEKKTPALDPALFKDKVVFIGGSAAGLLDNRPSPVSPVFPGTEILAAATDNILNKDFLVPASSGASFLLVLMSVLSAFCAVRFLKSSMPATAALSAGLALFAVALFQRGVWLDMALPQLSLWLSFAATSAYSYAVEGRQRRFLQAAFGHYLSPEVVRQIAEDPKRLALGGERRELSVYFSDIEGFTTISEGLSPEKLTLLMNRYLDAMTETVLESDGTLDKYIGDAVMAFWGAPLPREDHALAACRVALKYREKLDRLSSEFVREGLPAVRARIGLNSGPAVVGNLGSSRRFSYTAMGDTVNLASRLEGANKNYGSWILISESTKKAAGDAVETRALDFIKVKGKNLPIGVYELLGLKGETDAALLAKARLFESGLDLYRARRWEEAVSVFERVLPDDAAEAYLSRCRRFQAEPPPGDWDGSYALKEK
jgi:adenylate cyclase